MPCWIGTISFRMKDENKVVYLTDYIESKELITTVPRESTPLNLSDPKSHLAKRGVAFAVDMLLVGVVKTGIHGAYALYVNEFLAPLSYSKKMSLIEGNLLMHGAIFISIFFAYFLYSTLILEGKTVGKMAMGLRVINESFFLNQEEMDYKLSLPNALRRSLGYVLCYLSFGTFFIFNFSSEDKRGLPDYLSNSRTVSDEWLKQSLEHREYAKEQVYIDVKTLEIKKSA